MDIIETREYTCRKKAGDGRRKDEARIKNRRSKRQLLFSIPAR
jgi:hypothetical protein